MRFYATHSLLFLFITISISISYSSYFAQGKKKNPEVKIKGDHSGGSGGLSPPEAEENTIFFTLKMQFQGLSTHKLLGPSINATPKLLPNCKGINL